MQNNISYISKDAFRNTSNLDTLLLHFNSIPNVDGTVFSNLTNLRYLWLNNNALGYLDPKIFAGLSSLEQLRLDENNIDQINSCQFQDQVNMLVLRLGNNNFSAPTCCQLSGLPGDLSIGWNRQESGLYCGEWLYVDRTRCYVDIYYGSVMKVATTNQSYVLRTTVVFHRVHIFNLTAGIMW